MWSDETKVLKIVVDGDYALEKEKKRIGMKDMRNATGTIVYHAPTKTTHSYALPPREAVLAAFALSTMADPKSQDWEQKYGHLVERTADGWVIGDWSVKANKS